MADGEIKRIKTPRGRENQPRGINGYCADPDGAAGAELSDLCGAERAAGGVCALRCGAGDDRPAVRGNRGGVRGAAEGQNVGLQESGFVSGYGRRWFDRRGWGDEGGGGE